MILRLPPYAIPFPDEILHGRSPGKAIREIVTEHIEELPANSVLPLDFEGVRFVDYSFSDEFVAKLVKRIAGGDLVGKFVVLYHLSDLVRENIQAALTLRQLVAVHQRTNGDVELLGRVNEETLDTFNLARTKGKLTARDLSIDGNLSITASSNRLSRLTDMGIMARVSNIPVEAGGRQYVFSAII
ncbi:hypothetical protein CCAX7_35470 [Capsulimonas corticalis]|uniref:Uncharacterized protein n=1 Tax=Capsulimonas corticalis TaxID=2219043 RepID=A0A402D672_9BACT|nr:hypothetical protein [Capsulimonas corticalis]BDI31496.1 hypothetical protein CCAX7_35470 [Capsulimonas corticalis]